MARTTEMKDRAAALAELARSGVLTRPCPTERHVEVFQAPRCERSPGRWVEVPFTAEALRAYL